MRRAGDLALLTQVSRLWEAFLDLILPPARVCAGCGGILASGEELVCRRCRESVALVTEPTCTRCGRPLTHPGLCRSCRCAAPSFTRAWSAAIYRGPLRQCLHRFKYGRETALAQYLAGLVLTRLKIAGAELPEETIVVPVPLDACRRKERGFNQAELVAREVAAGLRLPLVLHLLKRTRPTLPQSDLTAEQRADNVAGAFAAGAGAEGKVILLVDDIYTTGATAEAASQALLAAGAQAIYVATVAIASSHPRPRHGRGGNVC